MQIINKRPVLFEKTSCNIWTDPYIQKQMLQEHLNPASDGASRKNDSIARTVNFIDKEAGHPGSLLDLGCGPGLYTELFKDRGYSVTGIDFNKASIDYAKMHNKGDINYIQGDYIKNFPSGIHYDTVILIYCDMGTHPDDDRDMFLRNIYHSLNEGGKFIFDVFTDKLCEDKKEENSWEYSPKGGFWSDKEYLLLKNTFHYPHNKAFAYQYNLITNNETKYFIVWERYYTEDEIKVILKKIGFRNITIHKNLLDDNNFTSNNEIFIVAQK